MVTQNYINAKQNYPLLPGTQSNSYKCFLRRAGRSEHCGVQGFCIRRARTRTPVEDCDPIFYQRLRSTSVSERASTFPGSWPRCDIIVSTSTGQRRPSFFTSANLFHPATVDACFAHDGSGTCPGIKDRRRRMERFWTPRPDHSGRGTETLALFARLYDDPRTLRRSRRVSPSHACQRTCRRC